MRSIFSLCFFVLFGINVSAQNYSITPNDTLNCTAPFGTLSIFDIYQHNISGTILNLRWTSVSVNFPAGWDYSLCDKGHCYAGVPSSGTMDPVDSTEQGFLGLNIDPMNITGTGTLKIYVYEDGNFSNGDTLTWFVTSSPDAVVENGRKTVFTVFPNPAQNFLNIPLNENKQTLISVFNVSGSKVAEVIAVGNSYQLDITSLPAGSYIIRTQSESAIRTSQFAKH